jgi:hypothetical protein
MPVLKPVQRCWPASSFAIGQFVDLIVDLENWSIDLTLTREFIKDNQLTSTYQNLLNQRIAHELLQ